MDLTEQPMKVRNCPIIAVVLMAFAFASAQSALAQLQLPFRKSKTDAKSFELTDSAGPWLIMCYSFSGDDGLQQAQRLASELRQHKLEAYTYTHRFDLTDKIRDNMLPSKEYVRNAEGKEVMGADGKPILIDPRYVPASSSNITETAVLVGSFHSADDEQAQKLLGQIKRLAPKSLAGGDPDALADDSDLAGGKLRFYRNSVNQALAKNGAPIQTNALRNAFLLPNPMLPEEYFQANSIDDFVISINRKVRRYSLLDCPGKYSVRVATFGGKKVINSSKIRQEMDDFNWRKRNGEGIEGELVACANKANMLTKALRAEGIEAWEFHDRQESYVCVGSFDWLKKTDASGREVQNPEVVKTILKYRGSMQNRQGQSYVVGVPVPKSLRKLQGEQAIAYDMQPLPVVAPKAPKVRRAGLLSRWR
jgi:hypothetical protein